MATSALQISVARAQSVEAEALFRQGSQLESDGKLREACDAFATSNRIESRAGTLLRLGQCRARNHQLASAWVAFSDALARVKDPVKKKVAEAALAELEPKLSYLTVSVPDDSHVQGLTLTRDGQPLDPMLWNRALPVDGGKIEIGGHAPGHEEWKTVVEVPAERGNVHVDVPKFKELAQLVTPAPGSSSARPAVHDETEDSDAPAPRASRPSQALALGLAGGGVALGGVAVVLELTSRSKVSDARASCPDLRCAEPSYSQARSLVDSAALQRNVAIATGVLAVAGVATGAYLYLRSRRAEPSSHAVRVRPASDGRTVAVLVDGTF